MTLVEFLRARLDEDEQWARAAAVSRSAAGGDLFDGTGIVVMHVHGGSTRSVTLPSNIANFASRFDPARMLAEVEAKRRIVDLYEYARLHVDSALDYPRIEVLGDVLARLALPYADHPDYDPGWRVAA